MEQLLSHFPNCSQIFHLLSLSLHLWLRAPFGTPSLLQNSENKNEEERAASRGLRSWCYVCGTYTMVNRQPQKQRMTLAFVKLSLTDICKGLISVFKANIICLLLCWVICSHFSRCGLIEQLAIKPLRQPQWKLSRLITLGKYAIFISILLFPRRLTIHFFFSMACFHEISLRYISKAPIQMVQLRGKFEECLLCCYSGAWCHHSELIQKENGIRNLRE